MGAVMEEDGLTRLGRYIGPAALPGDRATIRRSAEILLAPDDLLADLDRLPPGATYHSVVEIWDAVRNANA